MKQVKKNSALAIFAVVICLIVGGGFVAGAAYLAVFSEHSRSWGGDGRINIFPSNDSSKNYRLDARIIVTKSGTLLASSEEYTVSNAVWPNHEILEFKDACAVSKNSPGRCTGSDGTEYRVEVQQAPEEPSYSD